MPTALGGLVAQQRRELPIAVRIHLNDEQKIVIRVRRQVRHLSVTSGRYLVHSRHERATREQAVLHPAVAPFSAK